MPTLDLSGISLVTDELVKEARAALADGHVSFGEIVSLGGVLAGKANQLAHLSGAQKKAVVLAVLDSALAAELESLKAEDAEGRAALEAAVKFAKDTIPSVLDLAVAVARGKLDLKKTLRDPVVRKSCWTVALAALRCVGSLPSLPEPMKAVAAAAEPQVAAAAESAAVEVSVAAEAAEAAPAPEAKTEEAQSQPSTESPENPPATA